jgi:hypothetical protein
MPGSGCASTSGAGCVRQWTRSLPAIRDTSSGGPDSDIDLGFIHRAAVGGAGPSEVHRGARENDRRDQRPSESRGCPREATAKHHCPKQQSAKAGLCSRAPGGGTGLRPRRLARSEGLPVDEGHARDPDNTRKHLREAVKVSAWEDCTRTRSDTLSLHGLTRLV